MTQEPHCPPSSAFLAQPDGAFLAQTHAGDLRRVFDRQAANVALVTACHRGVPVGVLVTSLASLSSAPPLISFNISSTSSGWPALEQAEHIGLHLLAAGQEELADRFSPRRSGIDGFSAPTSWQAGPHGVPVLSGCAAWTVARPQQRIHAGDRVIIVARLLHGDARDGATPLLSQAGTYLRLTA